VGDGFVETLSARLGDIPGSQVVTPTAAVSASDTRSAPFRAADSVGANLAVRSSFMRSGDTVRIAYSVWNVKSRTQVASGTVDGRASDLFEIQDRLAESVAAGLKLQRKGRRTPTPSGLVTAGEQERYVSALGDLQRYDKRASVEHAIQVLEGLASEARGSPLVHAALGRAYLLEFNLTREPKWIDLADRSCTRARQLDPNLPDVDLVVGDLRVRTGKPREAILAYQRVLTSVPNHFEALLGLAKARDLAGDSAGAETTYLRAIQLQPSFWQGYSKLGAFYYNRGRIQKAAEAFQRVTVLSPDNARAFSNLGGMYELQGQFDRALAAYQESLRLEPTSVAYGNVGTLNYFSGRFPEASQAFRKAIELTPNDFQYWAELGDAYRWTPGAQGQALKTYQKAIQLGSQELSSNPNNAFLHSKLAVVFAKLGNRKEADGHMRRAFELDPKNADLMYDAAIVACLARQPREAIDWLRRATETGFGTAHIEREPEFESLRKDKAFRDVLSRAQEGRG
jgi:eukaryotic-like serine/threonine-protein kinase